MSSPSQGNSPDRNDEAGFKNQELSLPRRAQREAESPLFKVAIPKQCRLANLEHLERISNPDFSDPHLQLRGPLAEHSICFPAKLLSNPRVTMMVHRFIDKKTRDLGCPSVVARTSTGSDFISIKKLLRIAGQDCGISAALSLSESDSAFATYALPVTQRGKKYFCQIVFLKDGCRVDRSFAIGTLLEQFRKKRQEDVYVGLPDPSKEAVMTPPQLIAQTHLIESGRLVDSVAEIYQALRNYIRIYPQLREVPDSFPQLSKGLERPVWKGSREPISTVASEAAASKIADQIQAKLNCGSAASIRSWSSREYDKTPFQDTWIEVLPLSTGLFFKLEHARIAGLNLTSSLFDRQPEQELLGDVEMVFQLAAQTAHCFSIDLCSILRPYFGKTRSMLKEYAAAAVDCSVFKMERKGFCAGRAFPVEMYLYTEPLQRIVPFTTNKGLLCFQSGGAKEFVLSIRLSPAVARGDLPALISSEEQKERFGAFVRDISKRTTAALSST